MAFTEKNIFKSPMSVREEEIKISLWNVYKYRPSLQGLFRPRAKKLSQGFIVSSSHHLDPPSKSNITYQQQLVPLPPGWRCSCGRCSARSIRAERLSRSPTSSPDPRTRRTETPSSIPERRWNPSRNRRRWSSRSASCRIILCNDWRSRRSACTVLCRSLKF